ncbi:MAG: extracellular solute-binding protein [Clostridia bacterium]|nr:extracellular solute-binding protein [Clostridia bacterium]
MKCKKFLAVIAACALIIASLAGFAGCKKSEDVITLRVCSWEEYIDLGGWDEAIELESGKTIKGEKSMVDDFTEEFNKTHDYKVKVEYSTFGTNEDLYNRLSLGDEYDLVCPSDYMLMKLIDENRVEEFSAEFLNKENAENYYINCVSPYIANVFDDYKWSNLAACYMWGTTGLVYNPKKVDDISDVSTWKILTNEKYKRQVTVKDNVRDAYFATLGIINSENLTSPDFNGDLTELLNDVSTPTIRQAEDVLKQIKDNVYSFETDAGKSDMVTGKVIANYQWSGDAVYIMDQADEDNTELWYSVPDECANLWFDGWVMLKSGIEGNEQRKTAAEAFINYLSRPESAVRNMYYIGYTSAIAGEEVFEYMQWNYAADEDAKKTFEYDLSYFFGGEHKIIADSAEFGFDDENINRGRQLFAQYPSASVIERSVVMRDFGDKLSEINQMWINVRCLDLKDISPVTIGVTCAVVGVIIIAVLLYVFRYKLFINYKLKEGYVKVEN